MAFKATDHINDISLHYAREVAYPYGTRGRRLKFRMTSKFHKTLEACFQELFGQCPLGKPEVITCAGTFVNKPGSHGRGAAFDFDAAFWPEYKMTTLDFPVDFELYLGIESYLRRHFGIVLNYLYNNAHKDHWHVDTSVTTGFSTKSRSKVIYLQMTLSYLYELDVVIDGIWGPQTRRALNATADRLGITDPRTKSGWMKYLDLTGKVAFQLFEPTKAPERLLNNVYDRLDEQPLAVRHALRDALNSFRLHPVTDAWLSGQRDDSDRLSAAIKAARKL